VTLEEHFKLQLKMLSEREIAVKEKMNKQNKIKAYKK